MNSIPNSSIFTLQQLNTIHKNFKKLDTQQRGFITIKDVLNAIPGLDQNPMASKVLGQASRLDKVDFEQFVSLLELQRQPEDEKLKFLFDLYASEDGLIDANDIFEVLKSIVGSQLDDEKLL